MTSWAEGLEEARPDGQALTATANALLWFDGRHERPGVVAASRVSTGALLASLPLLEPEARPPKVEVAAVAGHVVVTTDRDGPLVVELLP